MSNAGSSRISPRIKVLAIVPPASVLCNPRRRLYAGCDGFAGRRRGPNSRWTLPGWSARPDRDRARLLDAPGTSHRMRPDPRSGNRNGTGIRGAEQAQAGLGGVDRLAARGNRESEMP